MKKQDAKKILAGVIERMPPKNRELAMVILWQRTQENKSPAEICKENKIPAALYSEIMKQFRDIGNNNSPADFLK